MQLLPTVNCNISDYNVQSNTRCKSDSVTHHKVKHTNTWSVDISKLAHQSVQKYTTVSEWAEFNITLDT